MIELRSLGPADQHVLAEFLASRADRAMFLRSNLRDAGIVYGGRPFEALYIAAVVGGCIVGVAAHCWNGVLLLLAEEHAEVLAVAATERSRRPVTGIIGPRDEVGRARRALAMESTVAQIDSDEGIYVLDLRDLVVPRMLNGGAVTCRHPLADELPLLVEWRHAFAREALHAPPSDTLREQGRAEIAALPLDRQFILLTGGRPVAYAVFNAALPEIVQVGGVWTPPELRRRGYARMVVAGALLSAGHKGVSRAVLFTADTNIAARRAYAALGFARLGDWGILLFAPR